jgi:hypothetical protein
VGHRRVLTAVRRCRNDPVAKAGNRNDVLPVAASPLANGGRQIERAAASPTPGTGNRDLITVD